MILIENLTFDDKPFAATHVDQEIGPPAGLATLSFETFNVVNINSFAEKELKKSCHKPITASAHRPSNVGQIVLVAKSIGKMLEK